MKIRAVVVLSLFLSLAAASCGGGEAGGGGDADFVVPPKPASFSAQGGLNQAPPASLLAVALGPRPRMRPAPLSEDEQDAAEAEALQCAAKFFQEGGFDPRNGADVLRVVRDEYGSLHVKLSQTFDGVPVLGAGAVCHLHPDIEDTFTTNLVAGLDLDTQPGVPASAVIADALGRYGRPEVAPQAQARLLVRPEWKYVPIRRTQSVENRADFERVLDSASLEWEVVVAPTVPEPAEILAALLDTDPAPGDDDDEDTERTRDENTTRAGVDVPPPALDDFVTRIVAPAIRYSYDAIGGTLSDIDTIVERNDFQAVEGEGYGFFSGHVDLSTARWQPTGTYYLMDVSRPDTGVGPFKVGNFVLDAQNVATHDSAEMSWILDGNNQWGDGSIFDSENSALNSTRRQTPAVDVAYGVQMTWDFLDHVLSRWGPGGFGQPTRACVHYDDGYGDAHYNPSSHFICFGDGGAPEENGNYRLGTVAHELGHAFWHHVGNGTSTSTAKALNEGHGDIQGGLVSLYRGTGLGAGTQVRHFNNFADWTWRAVDPDGYTETDSDDVVHTGMKYWTPELADKPPHVAGLPFARAMIYLAEGAPTDPSSTLYTTEFPGGLGGIGIGKAAQIWQIAVAYYVAGSPDYLDMRNAFIGAASYLYGPTSMENAAVRRAFAGVKVGFSTPDFESPGIGYAQVFAVNPKDMTALVFAWPTDDTGFRELRVDGHQNNGVYKGDFFLGWADISRAPLGVSEFAFTIEDSDGKTTTVDRPFLKARDRNLIENGDFEDGMTAWTTFSGDGRVSDFEPNAFIGNGYMTLEGNDKIWQEVTIPPAAEDVCLVFRLLVRDSTKAGDALLAEIQDGAGVLETLATYDKDTPQDTRNWLNKGYLRQEFDLSAYAGQTIRITFVNFTEAGKYRFLVDQVALTYVEEVTVGLPQVTVNTWENTVSFTLPEIAGLTTQEIKRVDWYIDNVFVGAGPDSPTDYYGAWFLSALTPGAHWVAGRVRGLDNAILADTSAVWFEPQPLNELLVNTGFESGAWDLTYSTPPPGVIVVQNAPGLNIAFDGTKALRMGGLGVEGETLAGQAVSMPPLMATLDFSVRLKIVSQEDGVGEDPEDRDQLRLELWNLATFQQITELFVADYTDIVNWQGDQEGWRDYVRMNVSIPPALVNGKNVLVRLKTVEDDGDTTWFYVDNASLRYTTYGLAGGN